MERVGGDRPIPVDVRVVVATHRNLEELVKQGRVPPGPVPPHLRFPARAAAAARARRTIFRCWWTSSRAQSPSRTAGSREITAGSDRGAGSAIPGRAMCASCATWWSACCCWRTTRGSGHGAARAARHRCRALSGAGGTLAERMDVFEREVILARTQESRLQYDRYRPGARAGAQPPVQESASSSASITSA